MNKITTDEQLEELGFHKYAKTPFDSEHVMYNYQKRFDDDKGKKYFLDCHVFDFSIYDVVPYDKAYEFETQVRLKNRSHINITFLTDDYDEVVEVMEEMFNDGKLEYYELWDEEDYDE